MKKSLNIGIASFAHMHAYSYFNNLKYIPGVNITAIAEENEYSKPKVKDLVDVYYEDYEKLAKDPNVDVVLVTTENANHKRAAILAMENGKDVIVEKPIATTLKDAEEMINKAKTSGQKLVQCYPCRFHPSTKAIKDLIDKGSFGELLMISATNHGQMPESQGSNKWFSDKALSGGGALMDHITHVADLNFWFSGQEIESVYALKSNFFHPDINIDDAGIVYLNYKEGLKGTIDPSWSRPKNFETWGDLTMTIYGTEQTATLDMFAQSARLHSNKETHPILIDYGTNMDYLMMKDFVDHLRSDEQPMLSGIDGKNALEVALMAYESTETNSVVYKS